MRAFCIIAIFSLCLCNISCFQRLDHSNPLILTPYLKQGKVAEARSAARVKFGEFKNVQSYSGYFTVDETNDSNLFFWFFPSKKNYKKSPVLLWLQGGPGASSLYGLFIENGPFGISEMECLDLRKHSWTENYSVIYIDSPIETGFSFTKGDYARNEIMIGNQLYHALQQFFQVFPELQNNEFFITGQSYAGKYIPALGYVIHQNNPAATQKINLQGLAIGNGLSNPEQQNNIFDFIYQIGLMDINNKFKPGLKPFSYNRILDKKCQTYDIYNFLSCGGLEEDSKRLEKHLNRPEIKVALHAENKTFVTINPNVSRNLNESIPVVSYVSLLLRHYKIMFYTGQLDIAVPYTTTVNFLLNLNFNAADEYKLAKRKKWHVGSELAGYVKQAGNLTEVLVRNAGHMVPKDQPAWAFDLITRFIHNNFKI